MGSFQNSVYGGTGVHKCQEHERGCPQGTRVIFISSKVYLMYHGTSEIAAGSILAHGFTPSIRGMLGPGVYLSTDIRKARSYGTAVLECRVHVGCVKCIDQQGHPLQTSWQSASYDTAWV